MSYEANAHEAQMKILRALLFVQSARFADLQKTTELSSDHFTFHLKKLVEKGYVTKSTDKYTLSTAGKEYANRMDTDEAKIEKQPKVSVLLIVEDDQGRFLSQQRLKQPYYGFWGRMSGKVRWSETLEAAAARELKEETGLVANFRYAGLYHKMDYAKDGSLLEDKYFMLMYGSNPQGEFITDGEGHHNEFLTVEEIVNQDKVFSKIPEITAAATSKTPGLIELAHTYDEDEY